MMRVSLRSQALVHSQGDASNSGESHAHARRMRAAAVVSCRWVDGSLATH